MRERERAGTARELDKQMRMTEKGKRREEKISSRCQES